MTFEEAKNVFLNRGWIPVENGTIYDGDKWRESVLVISKWLEQEPDLNKIRTEIEEIQTYDGLYIDRAYVLQILDKYRAESGGEEE